MAVFTDKEKVDIICYLGWPGTSLVSTSQNFNSIIDDRLGITDENVINRTLGFLKKLRNIDDKLEEALCRAATTKVDNVSINKDEILLLNKERQRCIKEMAVLVDISKLSSGGSMGSICH